MNASSRRGERVSVLKRITRFYRHSLTRSGRGLLWVWMASALLGMNTFQNRVYMVFAVATAIGVSAAVASVSSLPKVRVRGRISRRTVAGERLPWHLELTALAPTHDTWVQAEHLPVGVQQVGAPSGVSYLGAQEQQTLTIPLLFRRRGAFDLEGVRVVSTHPFGLLKNGHFHDAQARVLVHPRFPSLDHFNLPLGARVHPGGLILAHATGDSTEFLGTREYRVGDPLRKLHAASWARAGTPIVRVDQEEYFAKVALVVDTGDPGDGRRLERSAAAAAAITDRVVRSHFLIDLVAAGPDLYFISAGRGLAHLEQVLDVLACLETTQGDAFERIAPEFFDRVARIATVVLLLLDWDDARAAFVEKVRTTGAAVRVLVIGTPGIRPPEAVTVIAEDANLRASLEAME